jgi:hypothetical protein
MAKKRTPEELARIKARKEFVQSNPELDPAEARKRFFVQTRVQELRKSGADVTRERRAALRQKFLSGDVQRQGFYTPTDVAKFTGSGSTGGSTGSSTSGNTGGSTTKKVVPRNRGMLPTPVPSKGEIIKAPSPAAQKGWDAEYGVERSNSNWYERNVAKPLQRYGATNPVGVPGQAAKDVLFGARNLVNETLGSMAATFTNPAINTVAGLVGKKPKLRQAGALEAAITTAGTIIDIGTAGGSKPLTTALSKVAQKGSQSLLKKNAVGTATTLSNVARKSKAAIEAAEQARMSPRVSGLENLTQSGRGVAAPGAFPAKKYSRMKDVYYDLNAGTPADVVSAKKALLKPPGKPSRSTPRVAKKNEPEFISGGLDGTPTFKNPTGTKTPRRKKVTTTETPGGPAVSTKTGKPVKARKPRTPKAQTAESYVAPQTQGTPNAALQAQLQAQADKTIATGLSKAEAAAHRTVFGPAGKPVVADPAITMPTMPSVAKPKVKKPKAKKPEVKKSVKLTPEEQPWTDKTPASTGEGFKYPPSPWEVRAQRQAQASGAQAPKSLAEVKSAGSTSTTPAKTRPTFRTIFENQKDFDDFMDAGGQGVVRSQTLGVQDTFIRRNRQFIDANRKASAQRALASKVDAAKRKAEVKAINEANGFVRTVVPKSQQALRQPAKKAAPVKKAAAKKAAPAKKAAKKAVRR